MATKGSTIVLSFNAPKGLGVILSKVVIKVVKLVASFNAPKGLGVILSQPLGGKFAVGKCFNAPKGLGVILRGADEEVVRMELTVSMPRRAWV